MYAVIRSGGKQYRVEPGARIRVERLAGEVGDTVEFADVLLVGGDQGVTVGAPLVENVRVTAEIAAQARDKKVVIYKYKPKVRYRRLRGHRQPCTWLRIQAIEEPGAVAPKKATRRRRKVDTDAVVTEPPAAEAAEAIAVEAAQTAAAEVPQAEAIAVEAPAESPAPPKRTRRRKSTEE